MRALALALARLGEQAIAFRAIVNAPTKAISFRRDEIILRTHDDGSPLEPENLFTNRDLAVLAL